MAYNYGYVVGHGRPIRCECIRLNIRNIHSQIFGRRGHDRFDLMPVGRYPPMQNRLLPYDPVPQNDIRDDDQNSNSPAANLPLSDSEIEQLVFVEKFDANSKREEETEASSSAKSGEESKKSCSICLDEILDGDMQGKVGCCHEFHAVCIKEWLKTSPTCPQCRYNVRVGAVTSK